MHLEAKQAQTKTSPNLLRRIWVHTKLIWQSTCLLRWPPIQTNGIIRCTAVDSQYHKSTFENMLGLDRLWPVMDILTSWDCCLLVYLDMSEQIGYNEAKYVVLYVIVNKQTKNMTNSMTHKRYDLYDNNTINPSGLPWPQSITSTLTNTLCDVFITYHIDQQQIERCRRSKHQV